MRNDKTRKQRAAELRKRLERGPSFMPGHTYSPDEISRQYRLWAQSWVLDDLVDLVPELRKAAQEPQ